MPPVGEHVVSVYGQGMPAESFSPKVFSREGRRMYSA
jgi:hypothetical protein